MLVNGIEEEGVRQMIFAYFSELSIRAPVSDSFGAYCWWIHHMLHRSQDVPRGTPFYDLAFLFDIHYSCPHARICWYCFERSASDYDLYSQISESLANA